MKKAGVSIVVFIAVAMTRAGELDRYMEWQDRRDYQQRREERNRRDQEVMNTIFDAQQKNVNNAALTAMQQAKDNPCFETELAALKASMWPYIDSIPGVEDDYFAKRRALCGKWGADADDSADRRELANLRAEKEKLFFDCAEGLARNMGIDLAGIQRSGDIAKPRGVAERPVVSGVHPHMPPKPPRPTTEEVVDAAQSGLSLASSISGAMAGGNVGNLDSGQIGSILTLRPADNGAFVVPQAPLVRPGQRHPVAAHVVLSTLMEWEPEPGYKWNIPEERRAQMLDWVSAGVHWVPGMEHSEHLHVIAGEKEGAWEPAPGWRFASHRDDDWTVVRE